MHSRIPLLLLLALPLLAQEPHPPAAEPAKRWQNPSGTVTVTCGDSDSALAPWFVNGAPTVWSTPPAISRESNGTGHPLAPGGRSQWVDDRYLVFLDADGFGISVIDTQNREILLSHNVACYTAAPDNKSWAAIAYRSAPRREERNGKEFDTLCLIEPATIAGELSKWVDHSVSYSHIPTADLYALAMTKPLWTPDGKNVLLILCKPDGAMQAARIDVPERRIARLIPLPLLKASHEDRTAHDITAEIDARYRPALQALREELLLPGPEPIIEDVWPTIYNPTDSSPRREGGPLEPEIYEDSAKLIAHFRQRKDSGFITANEASANLNWRAERVIILNADLVSVSMSEGHVDVTGIYQRNHDAKSWDLIAEQGGKFRDRSLKDLPQEGRPAK